MPKIDTNTVVDGLGAFDELEFLDEGTFGTTFRAVRGDDEYAIKVMHAEGLPKYLLEREVKALSAIDHPNVVKYRGSGEFLDGEVSRPYIECEFVAGPSIKAALSKGQSPAGSEELMGLATGLLAGLDEMHELGIVHRDIKPGNIIIRDGNWDDPVVLDFGMAKLSEMSTHTALGDFRGTTAYASPEQLRGEPARQRSDLFSASTVIFEAGTGRHPFIDDTTGSAQDLHERMRQGPQVDLGEIGGIWTPTLAAVTMRGLSFAAHSRLSIERALLELEGDSDANE